jgi:ABC-type glutathione transport system ATPase component
LTIQSQIFDLLRALQRERAISVIRVTHDLGIVAETCQQVVVLYAGRVVEYGAVAATFAEPLRTHTKVSRKEMTDCVASLLAEVGLTSEFMSRHPHQLSGGQAQQIALGRASA